MKRSEKMTSSSSMFLDVDPTIVENNLRITPNEEAEFDKIFGNRTKEPAVKLVRPHPGLCLKTRELNTDKKVFINICTTDAIPPPKDITELELVRVIKSDDADTFKVPMSIGEVRTEKDKKGNEAKAVDIAINTTFFRKVRDNCIFRNFVVEVMSQGISQKHGLECASEKIIFNNRKAFGTLQTHCIQQREIDEKMGKSGDSSLISELTGEKPVEKKVVIETLSSVENTTNKQPEYRLYRKKVGPTCLIGEFRLPEVISASNVTLDVGEDRIVLESKSKGYLLDIFVPYRIRNERCTSTFDKASKILTLEMPLLGG
ncbi:unnamed protein product [Ceutorhynchus assimilis]|uniref:PIH1 domain-containing protein 1 n=1 Tax=Ceutorhynchus assimilis TaxID=467358 RepID=A0A9N9MYV8_9CUCU|nr:unnamed protein product [Ceutorhynchus assimilis]